MKKFSIICGLLILILIFISCMDQNPSAPPNIGRDTWLRITQTIPIEVMNKMDGIYNVTEGSDFFGGKVVLKFNNNQKNTLLSVYSEVDYLYMVLKVGQSDSALVLEGYWRNNKDLSTGLVRLSIKSDEGGWDLLSGKTEVKTIVITGTYGIGREYPMIGLTMKLKKSNIKQESDFAIVAHRGGGRTSDQLPASENSLGIIKHAMQYGATGIEIDVRATQDGVLILYHDDYYTTRLINGEYILGAVKDYTYKQIRTFCTLKDGSLIPTFREALDVVLYSTNIESVWIDTKATNIIDKLISIQQEYKIKAEQAHRILTIYIGIPDETIYNEFLNHPKHLQSQAICEIGLDESIKCGAKIWAPRWTLGMMTNEINQAHANNIKVYLWTVDDSDFMKQFITEGLLDGILTNFPYRVAWEYYTWKYDVP